VAAIVTRGAATGTAAALTGCLARTHNAPMDEKATKSPVELELKRLERRLDELVTVVSQLKEENRALRQRQDTLAAERASLLAKNEQVRARVEAMVGRLKSMESNA
jgi:cell division protein ZapB